ncbi:SAM and SH3 domain-containing protein 3 [Platysternon megacephalum]|uniref:SAM and SH3 domain-containing protein 3 n=1 Tax=Platysternon megacephalum TaxID=55544 RepID=A0A4D9E1X7_9SAUR|nr:SAM and SH3 domain-containing protein 3 [Platysternon megacephalum]
MGVPAAPSTQRTAPGSTQHPENSAWQHPENSARQHPAPREQRPAAPSTRRTAPGSTQHPENSTQHPENSTQHPENSARQHPAPGEQRRRWRSQAVPSTQRALCWYYLYSGSAHNMAGIVCPTSPCPSHMVLGSQEQSKRLQHREQACVGKGPRGLCQLHTWQSVVMSPTTDS